MSNSAEQLIYQASVLLEEGEDVDGAIEALREAVELSEVTGRKLELIRARTFLGELFFLTEAFEDSHVELSQVLELAEVFDGDPALVDEERATAKRLIEVMIA